jgi:transcriptional regulator with XRE-family HTH domain
MKINESIRTLRKKLGLTQDQFAQQLAIKRSLVGAYEEGRAEPRLELLQKIAALGGLTVDEFLAGSTEGAAAMPKDLKRGKEVVVVTIDHAERDNISLVPQKAAAGYLNGYADAEYVKELTTFRLPMLRQGNYRAFEISGDSMLPIMPGTVVIGEYVEDLRDLKNGKTYVLVTQREGIVYKRVFNYIDENGKLFLVSDNRQYSPYQINADEVLEAWQAKAYVSVQFPDVESKSDVSVEQLAGMVLELQKEINDLKQVKKK